MSIPNIKRWTEHKLDKELVFARAARGPDAGPEAAAWAAACEAEAARRESEGMSQC